MTDIARYRSADEWAQKNPILSSGVPGFEDDTGKLKIGNGSDRWNVLPYADVPPYTLPPKISPWSTPSSPSDDGRTYFALVVPTNNVTEDTSALQAELDSATLAGGGCVRLGGHFIISGVTIDSNTTLDLGGFGLTLAAGSNNYVVSTKDYVSLVSGDTTGGPTDWGIVNGYLDGAKAGQTETNKPVLAIYGRRYLLDNLLVRNGKGTGIASKWSTTSPFQSPNGFESFITNLYVHSCDGDGIDFAGPHDTYMSTFFVVKCGVGSTFVPLRFGDSSGRANGTNVQQFHIYGGNGYNYGLLCNTAGMRISNFVVEGAQVAQILVQASQVMLDGFHLYSGGIRTTDVKGIQLGDATHTNVNSGTYRGRVENCGGGVLDFAYAGDNNDIDIVHAYFSSQVPVKSNLGWVGTPPARTRMRVQSIDSGSGSGATYLPTDGTIERRFGPHNIWRTNTTDVRDLWDVRDHNGNQLIRVDYRGRFRINNGQQTPTVAAGSASGSGATATLSQSADVAGTITVTTGTSPTAGQLAVLTFSGVFGNAAKVVISPRNAASAAVQAFVSTSTATFSINTGASPAASTSYVFDYIVMGA